MTIANKFRRLAPSVLISAACLSSYIMHISFLLHPHSGMAERIGYMFTHANMFHLAANLFALARFKPRFSTCAVAFAVSFAATFIPFVHLSAPTCGLSGFLMACFARYYHAWQKNILGIMAFNAAFAFVPSVNWKIHIVSFLASYIIYYLYGKIRKGRTE